MKKAFQRRRRTPQNLRNESLDRAAVRINSTQTELDLMTTPEPIKIDLFRFVTLRSPQLISPGRKSLGFIHHPAPDRSHFLEAALASPDINAARESVANMAKSFVALSNYSAVKDLGPSLYEFSVWLVKERNALSTQGVIDRAKDTKLLDGGALISLWDNLFYQVLEHVSPQVRQACIQMILAQNFIQILKEKSIGQRAEELIDTPRDPLPPSKEEKIRLLLKRMAGSKVVVPSVFSVSRQRDIKEDSAEAKKYLNFSDLQATHEMGVAADRNMRLRTIDSELQGRSVGASRRARSRLSVAELKGDPEVTLSAAAEEFVAALPSTDVSVGKVSGDLRAGAKRAFSKGARGRGRNRKVIVSRGHVIERKADDAYCFTISFMNNELEEAANNVKNQTLYMTINTGRKDAFVTAAGYTLSFGDQQPIAGKQMETLSQSGAYLHLKLFPGNKLGRNANGLFTLSGDMALDDGTELVFDVTGNTANDLTNGCAEIKGIPADEPMLPIAAPAGSGVEHYGVNDVGVAVYRKVEQEVCCYVPGEVSRIENILAREYKERHTRNKVSTEVSEELTTELEVEDLSDTATTERDELQTEVATVLSEDDSRSMGASLGVSGNAFGAEVSTGAYVDFNSSTSASTSDSAAKTYAEEVTQRALERVVQKTTDKRTSRILKEFEESNRHGFDNRAGDQHVTGVYRWVDIIYTNRLINYGKRLMYEFMIPEPAFGYKFMLELLAEKKEEEAQNYTTVLEAPIHPSENGITDPSVFNEDNYLEYGRLYGVTIPDPLPLESLVSDGFAPVTPPDMKDRSYNFELLLPPEYHAVSADADITFEYKYSTLEHNTKFNLGIGDKDYVWDPGRENIAKKDGMRNFSKDIHRNFNQNWSTSLPVQVSCKNVNTFMVSVFAILELKGSILSDWQNNAYDLVMRAYEDELQAYDDELEAEQSKAQTEDGTADSTHRGFNRSLEMREIQRVCIEMLTKPFGIPVGKNFYRKGACTATVKQNENLEKYSSHVKFFEQAFDWANMSYLFYPYYWADPCDWYELMQMEYAPDPTFQAFLQSGMARVAAPVRPGFEDAVSYYMETGDIWNGGDLVLDTDDDLYLSIAEELQEIEGVVEESWQTRVPTSLTIVQGDSVYLNEGGLPCCPDVEDGETTTNLDSSSAILGGPGEASSPEG